MALNQFPMLPGLAWSVTKQPAFKTRIQKSVSGRERRALDHPLPIWTWTLSYDFLRDNPSGGNNELRTLMAFHAQQQGAFTGFLYTDPSDNAVSGSNLGTGNASQTAFQLVRNLDAALPGGGYAEPIVAPNILTFTAAPGSGVVVTADFSYFFRVRFTDDTASFENFMYQLWRLKQIKFTSILL
jgi:hypothetical protein